MLKLHDAAEALPTVLDRAQADGTSMTAALEELLNIEVAATEARRLAGRLRFACLPTPAKVESEQLRVLLRAILRVAEGAAARVLHQLGVSVTVVCELG